MNMLPLPGAPGSSWAVYKSRFRAAFEGAVPRVCIAFWMFGTYFRILRGICADEELSPIRPDQQCTLCNNPLGRA